MTFRRFIPMLFALAALPWLLDAAATPVIVHRAAAPVLAAASTQWIADEGQVNFTPTVIQGAALKFAASDLPTGASVNSATGAITGMLSTPGLWKTRLTAYVDTDGDNVADADELQDHLTVGVIVYSSTVTLNAAYVTAAGGFPVTLKNCEHTRFVLGENLDAAGNAFILADNNIYIDGDGHELHYGGANGSTDVNDGYTNREHAFELYVGYGSEVTGHPAAISGGTEAQYCAIVDVHIINDGTDPKSHAIDSYRAEGLLLADSQVETAGKDSHVVFSINNSAGGAFVLNSVCQTAAATSFNRHSGPANLGSSSSTRYTVERCVLLGGNSGITGYGATEAHRNVISHSGSVTNGYGVWMYYAASAAVTHNLILPTNGRGILCNGGTGHTLTDNVILHLEAPNVEFGDALNPPAVRARYGTAGITYARNTSLGIGGTDLTSASTIYITSDGSGSSTYEDNTGDVILIGTPGLDHYAQPVTLEGTANGLDVVARNTLRSNHNLIRVEGYDGYPTQLEPLSGNRFEWVAGDEAYADFMEAVNEQLPLLGLSAAVQAAAETRVATIDAMIEGLISGVPLYASRAAWHVKYYSHNGTTSSMDVLDSDWGTVDSDSWTNGASALSAGAVNVREGFTQSVQIKNSGGTPLNAVVVTVTSDQGDVTTATTDASGNATLTFFRFAIVKANATNSAVSVVNRTSSTVSYGGQSAVITHASVPESVQLQ